MDINEIKEKLKQVRENSKERKFAQNFDLIFNLQNMDLRKPTDKIDFGVIAECNIKAKKLTICAVIDHSIVGAEEIFDKVIYTDDLTAMKGDLKKIRVITHGFDKFVVQANVMPLFAQILGRYLGPMNKMPSPKLGMIISPKTPLKELAEKLQKTIHVQTKKNLVLQVTIGSEKENDDVIAKNLHMVHDGLLHALPNQNNNLKNVSVKLTMGGVVRL